MIENLLSNNIQLLILKMLRIYLKHFKKSTTVINMPDFFI